MTTTTSLAHVEVRNGVNERGEPFCTIVATSDRGGIWLGQLTPTEVRGLALQWLEVAEAAEQDAAVLRCVRKLELPDELAGRIVIELRNSRAE